MLLSIICEISFDDISLWNEVPPILIGDCRRQKKVKSALSQKVTVGDCWLTISGMWHFKRWKKIIFYLNLQITLQQQLKAISRNENLCSIHLMGIISKYQILREPDGDYVKDFVPFKLYGSYYKMLDFFSHWKAQAFHPHNHNHYHLHCLRSDS